MFQNLIRQSPINRLNHFPPIFPWLFLFMNWLMANGMASKAKEPECSDDADCEKIWPNSNCGIRNRCQCAANELRRQSQTRGWVCLTLLDAGIPINLDDKFTGTSIRREVSSFLS